MRNRPNAEDAAKFPRKSRKFLHGGASRALGIARARVRTVDAVAGGAPLRYDRGVDARYDGPEPLRSEVDRYSGPTVLEFGTDWCGWCQAAQPLVAAALASRPDVRHRKIGDGKGKPLGRSFGVKLWPTFVFLRDGREVTRVVRPASTAALLEGLAAIAGP